jgi:hypothetical protein
MHATLSYCWPEEADVTKQSFGTIFTMALPKKDDPTQGTMVLVTAAHVLNDIAGDEATVLVRRKNSDGTYEPFGAKIVIRKNEARSCAGAVSLADRGHTAAAIPSSRPALVPMRRAQGVVKAGRRTCLAFAPALPDHRCRSAIAPR